MKTIPIWSLGVPPSLTVCTTERVPLLLTPQSLRATIGPLNGEPKTDNR